MAPSRGVALGPRLEGSTARAAISGVLLSPVRWGEEISEASATSRRWCLDTGREPPSDGSSRIAPSA